MDGRNGPLARSLEPNFSFYLSFAYILWNTHRR